MDLSFEVQQRIIRHCPDLIQEGVTPQGVEIHLEHVAIALGDNYHINCGTGDITRWDMHKALVKCLARYDLKKGFHDQERAVLAVLLANIA